MYSTYETPFAGDARQRGAAVGQEEGRHPRRRAEPHRPGHRVRLLLLPRRLRAEGGRLRNHHDQLQSGDGVDRLRHLRPALLRAADRRGRARDHRHRAHERHAARRDRAVRRPDAAQARRAAGEGQGADPRHLARRHRPRRGPRPLQAAARQAQAAPAAERHRHKPEAGARHRRRHRLSDRDPAVLRAGRPRHGDRARRRAARPLSRAARRRSRPAVGAGGLGQAAAADRPLSHRRHRGRRRLPLRRQGHLHRRHHGAHRGGRHPFRRFGLLAAALLARRQDDRRARAADPRAGAGAQRRRADERAVRHQGRRHLRARGQSARLAHGAVRRQGDRAAGRQDRGARHGRRDARLVQARRR